MAQLDQDQVNDVCTKQNQVDTTQRSSLRGTLVHSIPDYAFFHSVLNGKPQLLL